MQFFGIFDITIILRKRGHTDTDVGTDVPLFLRRNQNHRQDFVGSDSTKLTLSTNGYL